MEKEAGCLSYALFCNIEDKNFLNLLKGQSRKDFDLHLRSAMFGVLLGTKSLLIEPHGIHIYTIHQCDNGKAWKPFIPPEEKNTTEPEKVSP